MRYASTGRSRRDPTTRVVLDGAHVGLALTAAIEDLRLDPAHVDRSIVLLALAPAQDARDLICRFKTVASTVVCTRLHGDRPSRDAADLTELCAQEGIASEAIADPLKALDQCLALAADRGWLLVTGSLHLVGSLRSHVLGRCWQRRVA